MDNNEKQMNNENEMNKENDMNKKEWAIRNAIDSIIEKGAGDDGEGHTQG